jgi:RHS repeat-associated protein
VSRTAGGVTTTFHFSGNSITTETQGANVVAHYVYGVNRVSRDASGSFEYYHADGIGSTRQLSNDSQSVTQTTTYDAFGNVESSAGSSSNAYKYAGQWGYRSDGDDGLMHVGARYYDPLVGRFISADTYLGEIENPQSLNLYNYCEADPVNHADPTGHSPDGPGGTTYRIDWHEQPNPDMHIYHGGDETNVTHRGGWRRGMHRGKKLVPLAKSLRKLYRPIIKRFVKAAAKRIPFVGIGIIGYELYQTWRNPHSTWKDYALALL